MKIRKSFQFRLQPTKKQQRLLDAVLAECRWLYNEFLAQRKLVFEDLEMPLSKYQQIMLLPLLKEEPASLNNVHSQVLENDGEKVKSLDFRDFEDLSIKEMIEGSYCAKGIADASWSQFLKFLTYKAEDAGRQVKVVNPAYAIQDCF